MLYSVRSMRKTHSLVQLKSPSSILLLIYTNTNKHMDDEKIPFWILYIVCKKSRYLHSNGLIAIQQAHSLGGYTFLRGGRPAIRDRQSSMFSGPT